MRLLMHVPFHGVSKRNDDDNDDDYHIASNC
jgi:hypothetical protein